jgi:hypothetical protein
MSGPSEEQNPHRQSLSNDHAAISTNGPAVNEDTEFIDSIELGRRWKVPTSWIRDQVRSRALDPLPHINLGKYVRFIWGSQDLEDWLARRIVKANNRRVERVR